MVTAKNRHCELFHSWAAKSFTNGFANVKVSLAGWAGRLPPYISTPYVEDGNSPLKGVSPAADSLLDALEGGL
jgi:hypothetical protein